MDDNTSARLPACDGESEVRPGDFKHKDQKEAPPHARQHHMICKLNLLTEQHFIRIK